jgi:crotonobetainyl-CoA:carnitine CoA-transferase CaiB-like acyl-CoA transferase
VLGVPELADDGRFAVADLRQENREELETLLAEQFTRKTSQMWAGALDDAGVPNEIPVDTKAGDLVLFDADNERLGLVAEYEHPIMGTLRQFGELIQFSDTPAHVHGPPPRVGEHTKEILGELGYDDQQIESLFAAGVINWPQPDYPWAI